MAIDLMSGLMSGANFGSGYLQGQQTAQYNQYATRMNQLALEDAEFRKQQQELSMKQQQALSDRAMQLFNPTGQAPAQGGGPNPSQAMPAAPTTTADKLDQLAQFAAGSGDLTHANELWTNAANLQAGQMRQQQQEAAAQLAEMKRQQLHYGMAAQMASTLPDSPAGLAQWKMMVLQDPNSTPQERQNVAQMQYSPGIMEKIRDSGMTAAQAATAKMRQMQLDEQARFHDATIAQRDRALQERTARDQAAERDRAAKTKVGAIARAPTSEELKTALPIVAEAAGISAEDPIFQGSEVGAHGQRDYNTPALVSIVSRAKQLVAGNRGITFPQAVTMATQEAKSSGELQTQNNPDTHARLFGLPIPGTGDDASTTHSFKSKGDTKESPLPLPSSKADLIPGKWYVHNGQVEQWTGQ